MDNSISIAKQCGERLRSARNLRNMSQQELAIKANTSPQNISKYEKSGISDIDTIILFSKILNQDLLIDVSDEEGILGEVGKEILNVLINHNGYINVVDLISNYMFGMNINRIEKEIAKLYKIGMCQREQFNDFSGELKDGLFITSKGAITYKNLSNSNSSLDITNNVITYEKQIGEASNYQEFVDTQAAEKIIRELPCNSSYRIDYIRYLQKNFIKGVEFKDYSTLDKLVPGKSCYHDILFRMVLNLKNDDLNFFYFNDDQNYTIIQNKLISFPSDPVELEVNKTFIDEFPNLDNIQNNYNFINRICGLDSDSDQIKSQRKKCSILNAKLGELGGTYNNTQSDFCTSMQDILSTAKSAYPSQWFTKEKIIKFINSNMAPAKNENEKEINRMLKEINRIMPETLEYYKFPKEWEDNRIAALILRNINL